MEIVWYGRNEPPAGIDIKKVVSLEDVASNALVFLDDQTVIEWEQFDQRRVYLVSDLPISSPMPPQISGVIPNDWMVVEAICTLYREMSESHDLGDRLIRSLNEKELAIQEKQALLLRDSRRYTAIIKNATDLIVVLGPSGKIMFSNDTLKRSQQDPLGMALVDCVVAEDRQAIAGMITKGFQHGTPAKAEARLELPGGRLGIFSFMSTPLTENGHVYALSVIGRDITDLRGMQQRLSVQAKDLAAMINGLSHELRNPLTVIGAYIKRIERDLDNNDQRDNAVSSILASITRIENMVTRIERYKAIASMDEYYTDIRLSHIVDELVRTMNLTVPVHIREENELWVCTSPDHVRIALARLLENAAQSGSPVIDVDLATRNGLVCVAVRDYGQGVSDDIETIFSPFFSSDPMKVGLGLTEARIALVKIGGEIAVDPQAEPGARFSIHIPRDRRWRKRDRPN